jgi:DNA polymerase-3 subunit delta'
MVLPLTKILGQDAAISALRQAYAADRMPHAMIFAGPTGVGKMTTAAALGALWLCEAPKNEQACGRCQSCQLMDQQAHPDFHLVTKELIRFHDKTGKSKGIDLSINVIRPEVVDRVALTPTMGLGKVFVIAQAELLNNQSANAMLKTLEEPAGRTIIILLTDQPGLLLSTIRSRCRTVYFVPLSDELVQKELTKRKIDSASASAAVAFAEGSLGLAIKWLDEGVVKSGQSLVEQLDALLAGRAAPGLAEWLKKAADAYAEKQLKRDELASKDQAGREGLALLLKLAAQRFRAELASESDPDRLESIAGAIDAIARAESYIDTNVNIALALAQLTLTLENLFVAAKAA